jgi:hypothetical protein
MDLSPLYELYMYANTPLFMYRRFREVAAVERLAKDQSAHDLVAAWNMYACKQERTVEDEVRAYAALVALSFVEDYQAVTTALAAAHMGVLRWDMDIKDAVLRFRSPVVSVVLSAPRPQMPGPVFVRPGAYADTASNVYLIDKSAHGQAHCTAASSAKDRSPTVIQVSGK